MIKFLAAIFGTGIAGITGLTLLLGSGDDRPAIEPIVIRTIPKETGETWLDAKAARAAAIRSDVEARFPGASEEILDLAADIANPDVALASYEDRLEALTPEEINAGYGAPHGAAFSQYKHSLLREAVLSGNPGAGAVLIVNGGDITYNDNEMPFQASRIPARKAAWELRFPDYSTSSKFLAIWLRAGGDPNLTHPLYDQGRGRLLHHIPKNNLEALSYVLAAGADPWSGFDVRSADGAFLYRLPSFFESLAGSDKQMNEVAFRLAGMGFYDTPPEDGAARVTAAYDAAGRRLPGDRTNANLAILWAFKQAVRATHDAMDVPPGPGTNLALTTTSPAGVGGFWLAPNELHSADTVSQRAGDRDSWGGHFTDLR